MEYNIKLTKECIEECVGYYDEDLYTTEVSDNGDFHAIETWKGHCATDYLYLTIIGKVLSKVDKRFKVEECTEWFDCECCGSFEETTATLYKDGKPVIISCYSGHFGDGDNVTEKELIECFKRINIRLEIDNKAGYGWAGGYDED